MSAILVVNAGSSSIKYQVIEVGSERRLASGLVERIGEPLGRLIHRGESGSISVETEQAIGDHLEGFALLAQAFAEAGRSLESLGIAAVGHRVVQGGSEFVEPTVIDDRVAARILGLAELAPLHNPGNHQAIAAARTAFPGIPHVAVFDTAFHRTLPPAARTYALDPAVAAEHGVRRYGFHGISHEVVSRRAAAFLGRPVHQLKQVVLHLGNGASVCAVDRGRSVATSMGLTPLEGLVMGTRSGDIDAGALLHLMRAGYDENRLDRLLNTRSGLLGLAGSNDMRDVRAAADRGDAAAVLALDVYVQRIRHYLGGYLALLGGADAIVFTAGVGENSAPLRAEVCADLEWFGIRIDAARNAVASGEARAISADDSRVSVLVVPTDEEAEIARQTWVLVSG
ncbi:acetate/propionate family kinase [Leucobacter soli]|uniref:Acetate kinase n=1 Tax=Leucobacter soli TaxID=2812850 RepID=A0A916NW01_9MICO|nr:acetate kinase [Leucobacter soli]CAG7612918.1 Acetate kinase [Leucobacter soli]